MSEQAFAKRLRAVLADSGVTQLQLAELAGVSQPTISGILRGGQEPRLGTYHKIENALARLERGER